MGINFIRRYNYFSPRYYSPEYFCFADEFIKSRSYMLIDIVGKPLLRVKWGFDIDDNEWFKEMPVLLYVENEIYAINNWKLNEMSFDKDIIAGTEFIDWIGFYDPVTKIIIDKENEKDSLNFHIQWKEFDIGHQSDRIIQEIIPLVYDKSSGDGYAMYDSGKFYGKNKVLDYYDEIYPEIKHHEDLAECQALVGLCFKFRTWSLMICNGLDENCIEIH